MHELGVVIEVVKTVENFAKQNGVTQIDTLVLQIGQLSAMIPHYVEACYPAAVDGTMLQDTKLQIEVMPANTRCRQCGQVFNIVEQQKVCPKCGSEDSELLSGREFMIKEIVAC